MTTFKNRKGFTLVELIVVIAVLALLAVGAVMAIAGIQRNARMTTNRNAANEMVTAFNRHNAIAIGDDRITAPYLGISNTNWVHEPMIPGSDSVTIGLAFPSSERWDQVKGWVSFNSAASVWVVTATGDDFDTPAR